MTSDAGDIIVTAEKRTERLRDVPISVSAVSGAQLERTGSTSLSDYATYVPGLIVNSGGTPGQTTIVLRGISTGAVISGSLVGTTIDDVPVGASTRNARASTFSLDLLPYDLDRLEVLRGPQGTLYGASTMGGLLKYVLKRPDLDEFEGRAGGQVETTANSDRPSYGLRAAVNVPIVKDVLAVRASGFYQNDAGWIDNVGLNKRGENSSETEGGRIAVSFRPTERLRFDASALLQNISADGNAVVELDGTTLRPAINRYSRSTLVAEPYRQRLRIYSLEANWDLGFATLVSVSSLQRTRNHTVIDQTAIYQPYFSDFINPVPAGSTSDFDLNINLKKFTQEVRLASDPHKPFRWLAGVFYTKEDVANFQDIGAYDGNHVRIPTLTPFLHVDFPSSYREIAGFGNLTYSITNKLEISGGVRYSHNKQEFDQDLYGALNGGLTQRVGTSTDNVVTWSGSAKYALTDKSNVYVRAASGYRPGGPNVARPGVPPSFKADTLINYEAGYKATLLNGKLDVDVDGFYIDWSDIQISVINNQGIVFPGNGGKASSRGFEGSATYRLAPGLRFGASAAYADAHLNQDVPTLSGAKGDQLPNAPHWTASFTGDWEHPINATAKLMAGAAYRYRGPSFSALESDPTNLSIRRESIVDAYVGASFDRITARIYVRNAFNDRSYTALFDRNDPTLPNFVAVQPRTIGLSVDTRF